MKIDTLEDAFIHGLSDIYSAEKQLTKALPKMADAASNQSLAQGFKTHLQETREQIDLIHELVEVEGLELDTTMECKAMKGLIAEGDEMIKNIKMGPIRDVMLIIAAQKVEHYEIATYGSLIEIANQLEYNTAAELLSDIFEQERATDEKLTALAIEEVNEDAKEFSGTAHAA